MEIEPAGQTSSLNNSTQIQITSQLNSQTGGLPHEASRSNPGEISRDEVTVETLQQVLASMSNTSTYPATTNQMITPLLTELLDPEIIEPVLRSPHLESFLPRLRQLLPQDDQDDPAALYNVIRSHPLRAQASALTNALASGSTRELLHSFSMPPDSGAGSVGVAGVQAFLRSLLALEDSDTPKDHTNGKPN